MAALTKLSGESDALYTDLCAAAQASPEGLRKVFFQSDIQQLANETAKDVKDLLPLVQELVNHSLLRLSKLDRALCWSTRPRDAATSISRLSADEKMVYSYVEDAHQKGIWLRELKKRTNINPNIVTKAMNKLENAHLIKSVKNIRAPAQKTYMLYHLVPSDDVTGGSFFDAGDLDESLIDELSNLIIFHVRMQSWADTKTKRIKREFTPPPSTTAEDDLDTDATLAANKKRKRPIHDIEDSAGPAHQKYRSVALADDPTDPTIETITQLAYQASSRPYPSSTDIHTFITTTDAIRASKAAQLTVAEIQNVVDVLVWDDKLEKIGDGYRTVRGVKFRPPGQGVGDDYDGDGDGYGGEVPVWEAGAGRGNGLTQVPCGRCPVFELCGDGGPVSAASCVYWGRWLREGG